MWLSIVFSMGGSVQADSTSIPEVRALYLYNFAMFIHWPKSAFPTENSPIRYCVLGDRVLRRTLARLLENEQVKGHPLELEPLGSPVNSSHCHLLYLDSTQTSNAEQILARMKNQPVVTVGESKAFPLSGGMIGLVRKGRRIRPVINTRAAEEAGIRISSKLLQLSTVVTGSNSEGTP